MVHQGSGRNRKREHPFEITIRELLEGLAIPILDSPGIKTFRLEHPLDSERQAALVRAAVEVGFQVFITELSDGPLKIESLDLAEFGIDGPTCEKPGLHLLLIDEKEIAHQPWGKLVDPPA